MIAKIYITYKNGILDPEGTTVNKALDSMGIKNIESLNIGKYIQMEFGDISENEAKKICEEACSKLLANHNTETYYYEISEEE
tara:strand:- start:215 stop:463 length:249 start_codon:yes stop_codon:yes gene_type:complete